MKKILGIGNALVDVMTILDDDDILEKFSLPKGSMQLVDNEKSELVKTETVNFKRNLASGGSAANTIHGLAMLGAETAYIGSIGRDELGDFFESDMKNAGIRTILSRQGFSNRNGCCILFPLISKEPLPLTLAPLLNWVQLILIKMILKGTIFFILKDTRSIISRLLMLHADLLKMKI